MLKRKPNAARNSIYECFYHTHACLYTLMYIRKCKTYMLKHALNLIFAHSHARMCVWVIEPCMRFYVRANIPASICISNAEAGTRHRNTCAEQLVQTRRIHA